MQYLGKMGHTWVFYSIQFTYVNVFLRENIMKKRSVIIGVIIGNISIMISNI